jgi:dihydrofolate synthase/folylpolyglutamate synthase
MTYEQAIHFLSQLVNYEQISPSASDLALEPIRALLDTVGNPHNRLFIIHVAGSKGKGSVAAMLELILRTAGYRTGLYTSPQLSCLEDRIRVNGVSIAPTTLAALVGDLSSAIEAGKRRSMKLREPTFFDTMTALAFCYFNMERVDVAIVEVGMGGRNDSTNICTPAMSIITNISYDHTQQLGNTLVSIATEKAGIIKPGIPTISGVTADEPRRIIQATCRQCGSPLAQLHTEFSYRYIPGEVTRTTSTASLIGITSRARRWPIMSLKLLGEHQAANAALAVAAVEQLQAMGRPIADNAVIEAFAQIQWPARIEVARRSPLVILDCAHNTASAQALAHTLRTSFPEHMHSGNTSRRSLLFAASRDKDLAGIMTILTPLFQRAYLTQYTVSPRCAPVESVLAALRGCQDNLPVSIFADPAHALQSALAEASAEDMICVTGSVFLAGEVRPLLLGQDHHPAVPGIAGVQVPSGPPA